jgi:hypothetical protein
MRVELFIGGGGCHFRLIIFEDEIVAQWFELLCVKTATLKVLILRIRYICTRMNEILFVIAWLFAGDETPIMSHDFEE